MGSAQFLHMSAIKDGRYAINIGGRERHLLFSLNALDEIQDKFGGYDKLGEVFNQENKDWIKNTRWLLTLLINEGADEGEPELTEKQVGRLIYTGNIFDVQNAILKAFAVGTSGSETHREEQGEQDEISDGADKGNAESGQVS